MALAGSVAGAAEDDLVVVFKEGAGLAGREKDGLGAVAGEFEQTAGRVLGWAGDGSGSEDVADLQITTVAGVVGDELGGSPVQVLGVGLAKRVWL